MPIEKSVLVPLGADETFALITEPGRLRRWQAITARVDLRASHDEGWDHYLGRLVEAAAHGDAGPDEWGAAPPELDAITSAEATLAICQRVLRGVAQADYTSPTVCPEFTVAQLADHLIGSVTTLDGTITVGPSELPATSAAGILSIEFLVHAWDFAQATGQQVSVPDQLAEHVLGVARTVITPEGRSRGAFAEALPTGPDAHTMDRLIAYTGRAQ
jgi:Mycothiol maleylpyruvate isomerase N-terminal domain